MMTILLGPSILVAALRPYSHPVQHSTNRSVLDTRAPNHIPITSVLESILHTVAISLILADVRSPLASAFSIDLSCKVHLKYFLRLQSVRPTDIHPKWNPFAVRKCEGLERKPKRMSFKAEEALEMTQFSSVSLVRG
jgi:hypothetical protein